MLKNFFGSYDLRDFNGKQKIVIHKIFSKILLLLYLNIIMF
jgi:hypothetical protein